VSFFHKPHSNVTENLGYVYQWIERNPKLMLSLEKAVCSREGGKVCIQMTVATRHVAAVAMIFEHYSLKISVFMISKPL
jgi:ApbE superfamily uncharacterized protein (UPF0280 family)